MIPQSLQMYGNDVWSKPTGTAKRRRDELISIFKSEPRLVLLFSIKSQTVATLKHLYSGITSALVFYIPWKASQNDSIPSPPSTTKSNILALLRMAFSQPITC